MNWSRSIDIYCERLDATYWAEPVNAVSNAAFLIAAFVMFRRMNGMRIPLGNALVAILTAIGIGSFLFHTHATTWASLTDVVPIGLFILLYLFIANREFAEFPALVSLAGTLLFIPYAAGVTMLADLLPFFPISNFYWSVPILLFSYAFALRKKIPETAKGMAVGGAILSLSITIRSLDMPICDAFPLGIHFIWHCLNGLMLGWMIEVYRRHRLAASLQQR